MVHQLAGAEDPMIVVVPCFQGAATVGAVVRGARAAGLEVVVVDDGSTDESAKGGRGCRRDGAAPSGQSRQRRGAGERLRLGGARRRRRCVDDGRRRAARSGRDPGAAGGARSVADGARHRRAQLRARGHAASQPHRQPHFHAGGSRASPGRTTATRSRAIASIRDRCSTCRCARPSSTPRRSCSCTRRR